VLLTIRTVQPGYGKRFTFLLYGYHFFDNLFVRIIGCSQHAFNFLACQLCFYIRFNIINRDFKILRNDLKCIDEIFEFIRYSHQFGELKFSFIHLSGGKPGIGPKLERTGIGPKNLPFNSGAEIEKLYRNLLPYTG
jgi:hypothetical protein